MQWNRKWSGLGHWVLYGLDSLSAGLESPRKCDVEETMTGHIIERRP
ncbi:MAG: hypothetical protein AB2792_10225 [Candidatus Thiodiazotropha sp.]